MIPHEIQFYGQFNLKHTFIDAFRYLFLLFCDGIFDPCRLVNMIHLTNLSVDNIWKIVKKITLQTIDEYCGGTYTAWDTRLMLLEQELQIKIDRTFENVTVKNLQLAGEIFIYFNTCPKSWKPWFKFYDDLFQTKSPSQILLTLNRLFKTDTINTPDSEDLKTVVQKIFNNVITDTFKLQRHIHTTAKCK